MAFELMITAALLNPLDPDDLTIILKNLAQLRVT